MTREERRKCSDASLPGVAGKHTHARARGAAAGRKLPPDIASAPTAARVLEPRSGRQESRREESVSTRACSLSSDDRDRDVSEVDTQVQRMTAAPEDASSLLLAECVDADRQLLVATLANVLTHMASLGRRQQVATPFHAAKPPRVSILEYLTRIAACYQCSDQCLVLSLVYIDRIVKTHPDCVVSPWSIHRLIMIGTMVAAKFWDDVYWSNAHYAKAGGIPVSECNKLEAHFLKLISWRLHVHPEEHKTYLDLIATAGPSQQTRVVGNEARATRDDHHHSAPAKPSTMAAAASVPVGMSQHSEEALAAGAATLAVAATATPSALNSPG